METDPIPATQPRPSPFDERARAGLDRALARLRDGDRLDEDAVVALAWEYFVAGFQAGAITAPTALGDRQATAAPAEHEDDLLADPVAALTPRRLEVLHLVARGLTNREIGRVLGISSYTVKSHLAALFESLDVTNRTEAAFALQRYEASHPEARN